MLLWILLFVALSESCKVGTVRKNMKCIAPNVWKYYRPKRDMVPVKAFMSMHCEANPSLNGPIGGFICNAQIQLSALACVNTKISYICMNSMWIIKQ